MGTDMFGLEGWQRGSQNDHTWTHTDQNYLPEGWTHSWNNGRKCYVSPSGDSQWEKPRAKIHYWKLAPAQLRTPIWVHSEDLRDSGPDRQVYRVVVHSLVKPWFWNSTQPYYRGILHCGQQGKPNCSTSNKFYMTREYMSTDGTTWKRVTRAK